MLSKHFSKRTRKGYYNYKAGRFRAVFAFENKTFNFTFYIYGAKDHMFDFLVYPYNVDLSYNKF